MYEHERYPQAAKRSAFRSSHMEYYDRKSLTEIRRMIRNNEYKSKDQAQGHLQFLQKLADKLNTAMMQEEKEGEVNWELRRDIAEVKQVFDELLNVVRML